MTNPLNTPKAFDYIMLDGVKSPGYCERTDGGERSITIEDQQSPGFAGAYVVVKGEKISTITYRFHIWTIDQWKEWGRFEAMLKAGSKKRPPRVYQLVDLFLRGTEVKQVVLETMSRHTQVKIGHHAIDVKFHEYRKKKPIGGVAIPPPNEDDRLIDTLSAKNADLEKKLEAMLKQAEKEGG